MPPHAQMLLGRLRRLASPTASDAALLARWIEQHDQDAFADLVARHGPMVLGVCRRVLGDLQDAEDAFQATFLVLARKAARLRRPQSLPGFLYGVALRLARKARGAARRRLVQPNASLPEPADPHPHPLDALSGRELLGLLDEEIHRLPEVYRLPLLLCVLQERPVEEAAMLLGWGVGSVRGRLARARERLRERLTRRGLCVSVGALALLAPVAVPERLRADAVRNLAAPISPAVNALAAAVPALKWKAVCLGAIIVAIGLGAGLPFLGAPAPEESTSPLTAAPTAQAKNEPRRDRYGDPLPPGAVARLGTLRFRAPGETVTLAFAPDGQTLAVSSRGGGLYLFDPVSGKRLRRIPSASPDWTPEDPIVFSPDGKRLAGRGHKIVGHSVLPVVRVWGLDGERRAQEYDIGQHIVWLGWSARNEPLAIRVEKGVLHLHDLAAGRSRRFACKDPQKYPSGVLSNEPTLACAPAGQVLALADNNNAVHVWDIATDRERCTLQPKGDFVFSLALSPEGSRLVSGTAQTVQMWDAATGKVLYTVAKQVNYLAPTFSTDGKLLAVADSWDAVCFWDAATGRERGRTQGKTDFAPLVAFSPDGKWLVTADRHGSAFHLWDVATGKQKPEPVGHTSRPWGTAFSPDGRRVATGGSMDGTFRLWDLGTGEALLHIQHPGMARDCALSADGRTLFASWSSGGLGVYDAATGERLHVMKLEDPDRPDTYQSAMSMHLSDDGKTLIAFSYYYAKKQAGPRYQDTLITGWDTATRKQLFRRRRPGMDSWVALSADARVLAVPHPEGRTVREMGPGKGPMRLEDLRTGELLLTFPKLEGQTWPLAFSPDGRLLASNNYDSKRRQEKEPSRASGNRLLLWETATAAEVLSLPAADFNRAAFSPDGRLLAVAAPAQEILVWDLAQGRQRWRFRGSDAEVIWLAFSPDGRRLISGLADSTLLVWDVGAPEAPSGKLGVEGVAKAWADLAGSDAPRAFRARWRLASAPEQAIPFLKDHVHAVRPADPRRLRRLLADLGSEQFPVREKAQADLEELGELAEPALRRALADKPTLEVRRRVQAVLQRLRGPVTRPETLRGLRAVAVLEDIGTPAARRLLNELAQGAPEARLTREAKAALGRLVRRTPPNR